MTHSILLIVDDHPIHKSKKVRQFVEHTQGQLEHPITHTNLLIRAPRKTSKLFNVGTIKPIKTNVI